MDISHLMVHAQKIEDEKRKERSREIKRAGTGDGKFSHARPDGHGCPRYQQCFSRFLQSSYVQEREGV